VYTLVTREACLCPSCSEWKEAGPEADEGSRLEGRGDPLTMAVFFTYI
jgi:hypothetical protein